jgi:hypothetical protein
VTTSTPATPAGSPEAFVEDLRARRADRLQGLVRLFPRNQPIASDIDPDSCMRRQVLELVEWQKKEPIPADRQGRLQAGDDAEQRGLKELREMGYRVTKEQVPFELLDRRTKEPVLRGKIDAFIEITGTRLDVPVEAKSMEPHVYDAIDTVEDLSFFWWTKKYLSQMQAYLIGYERPWGLFWLTNLRGDWKPIVVRLDYAFAERVWSYAENIVAAVKDYRAGGPPPPFTRDPTECTRCPFFGRACQPPIHEEGATVIEDEYLEAALERRFGIEQPHREFTALDRRIRERLLLGPEFQICGPFVVHITDRRGREGMYRHVDIQKVGTGRPE